MARRTQDIIVFDGICKLCDASVNLILKHDKEGRFLFTPMQSETGIRLLKEFELDSTDTDTILLVSGDKAYVRSEAVFEIINGLGGRWRLLSMFRFLPLPLRDAIYSVVAKHRYSLFGKHAHCMVPTKALKERFIT